MTHPPASGSRQGLAAGVGAYLLWGFLPLYFPLLEPASALDISAHRVVWSWLVCLLLLAITARFGEYTALLRNRQRMSRLALAAEIGRASCRERVEIAGGAVSVRRKREEVHRLQARERGREDGW